MTERSRFTGAPGCSRPSVERLRVSRETSAAKESLLTSSAVRQTPLTAIESPSWMSSVTRLRFDHDARVFATHLNLAHATEFFNDSSEHE